MIKERWDGRMPSESALVRQSRELLGSSGSWQRVLVKRWAWIAVIAAVVTGVAALVEAQQPHLYKAQAEVAVYPATTAGSALQPFVMGTEKGLVSSNAVLAIASNATSIPLTTLQNGLSVSVPVDTDILQISFSDPSPKVAQSAAESIAQAYIAYRTWKGSPGAANGVAPTTTQSIQAAIVSDAVLPTAPYGPNRRLIVAVALLLGIVFGIGVALLRDLLDDGLRGALDLEIQANAPVLAQIPPAVRRRRKLPVRLTMPDDPVGRIGEAYRDLRTRILVQAAWRRSKTLLVTSPGREDRTTVAANVAVALAQSGRNVILVCADLLYSQLHSVFGVDNQIGLADVIRGDTLLAEALHRTEVAGLQVLPAGQAFDPSSLLQSPAFSQLIGELRDQADFIVIEAPPVLAGADTAAIAELGGMILLTADARISTRAQVRAAAQELGHLRDDLIGYALTNVRRPTALYRPATSVAINDKSAASNGHFLVSARNGHGEPEQEHVTLDPRGGGNQ